MNYAPSNFRIGKGNFGVYGENGSVRRRGDFGSAEKMDRGGASGNAIERPTFGYLTEAGGHHKGCGMKLFSTPMLHCYSIERSRSNHRRIRYLNPGLLGKEARESRFATGEQINGKLRSQTRGNFTFSP